MDFMGPIDNLTKAATEVIENLYPDKEKRGGAYTKTQDGYELVLTNYILCPMTKEAFLVIVNRKGIVRKIKRSVYSKSADCAVI